MAKKKVTKKLAKTGRYRVQVIAIPDSRAKTQTAINQAVPPGLSIVSTAASGPNLIIIME